MPDWPHILCRADGLNAAVKEQRDNEALFSSYFPRPNATLFVVTRPLVHNALSILVPDRAIFFVKAGRAFSYGRKRVCRLERNIPRKIKSDVLLCNIFAYKIRLSLIK